MKYYADLHLHSYYSDGSDDPYTLIDLAAKSGLKAMAITDHDYYTYTAELARYAKNKGILLIPGIELSCVDPLTKRKVHLLAYHLRPSHPHVKALYNDYLKRSVQARKKMITYLNIVNYENIKPKLHGPLYKQHIAFAISKELGIQYHEAYQRYFKEIPLETLFPTEMIDLKKAIEAVLQDGGIPVLAHPYSYQSQNEIERYISYGLKGVEISHPSYLDHSKEKILNYPLIHTGGSDYHGQFNLSQRRIIGQYGLTEKQFMEEFYYDVYD